MRSAIAAAFLCIAGAIAYFAAAWIAENYVSRPAPDPPAGPFHHPGYRHVAENALRAYSALAPAEQAALRKNLQRNIVSTARWLGSVRASGVKVLCLGEDHEDATRQYLARTFFSELEIDALLLEVTRHQLGRITQELRWGRKQVLLLGADVAGIIRAARVRNPDVELVGIEETKSQRIARQQPDIHGTRDESIENNYWKIFRYGRRYAILFGALHCTNRKEWLYGRTRRHASRRLADQMLNVRVVEEHQDGPVEAFAHFLGKIGVRRDDFVVADSKALHPLIYEWFESLGVLFEDFTVVMVFRSRLEIPDG